MASILQKASTAAQYEAESAVIGPTAAGIVSKVAPPSTVMAFYTYFKGGATKLKIFFTKTIPSLFQMPRTPMKIISLSLLFLVVLGLGYGFYYFINSQEGFANNANNSDQHTLALRETQVQHLMNQLSAPLSAPSSTNPPPNTITDTSKLFNIQPLTFKQTAFLGPPKNGHFSNKAILDQLKTGSRSFFLQIDYIEKDIGIEFGKVNTPCLVYRDDNGILTSKNSANLSEVFRSINEYAFNDLVPNNTVPILIFLHFVRMPYSTTDTTNYINYMSKVSTALDVLRPALINGGYYRAAKEADLFANDFPSFNKTVIIGTNIDTTVFTRSAVDVSKDLDYAINFRYYVLDKEKVDITTVAPHNQPYNALIFNSDTVLSMDPITWGKYKNYFIIVKPSNKVNLSPENMNKLINEYGVNVVLYDYFDINVKNSIVVKSMYQSSYAMKPLLLQV